MKDTEKWPVAAEARGEGVVLPRCPLAAPTGAALHSTKRGSRYWRLRSAVAAAVHSASSPSREAAPAPQSAEPPALPSKLEVRSCALPQRLCSSCSQKT